MNRSGSQHRSSPAVGTEIRITLQDPPTVVRSSLPGPQAACGGWHDPLPAVLPVSFPVSAATTWGEFAVAAARRHHASRDDILVISPRAFGLGVTCPCGYSDETTLGQLGRMQCPGCGSREGARTTHAPSFSLGQVREGQTIPSAGLPPADIVWTAPVGQRLEAYIPWVLGSPLAPPPLRPRVGVLGCGALGLRTAELLLRLGYELDLCDMDDVEKRNLVTGYALPQVGAPKVAAAHELLRGAVPGGVVRPYHGDIITDVGLGVMLEWDAAALALDNVSARVAAGAYLGALGIRHAQGQIDGATATALVRTFQPGQTGCIRCLEDPAELDVEYWYGCDKPRRAAPGLSHAPHLYTTAVESHLGAALLAAAIRGLVPPPGLPGLPASPGQPELVEEKSNAISA